MAETSGPTFTQQVDQRVFIEPLGGPTNPITALDRFPDALYSKSSDTHFVKFMYSLLGAAGVGWIKQNYLEAKLALYAHGFTSFNIEKYYGDPFSFGRILLEQLPNDPEGLLTREQWDVIKSRDESYRNRAITYFNAVRAGGTPEGMELAAQSGLNHSAFVVENYKYLFDSHSDEPLGLPYYGKTHSTEEFIVVPRQDTSRSEQQIVSFASEIAASGTFQLEFNGQRTKLLKYNANRFEVEEALTALGQIGAEGVTVTGGSNPNPFIVTFTGPLSDQDVPTLQVFSTLLDNLKEPITVSVQVLVGGVEPVDETVILSDEYQHNAQTAIDFLRPLNSLPTSYSGEATRTRQEFTTIHASSSYVEAIKYVTGSDTIVWPEEDSLNWIAAGKEVEARRIQKDLQAHYVAYHSIASLTGYTDEALQDPEYLLTRKILTNYNSEHVGQYDPRGTIGFSFLSSEHEAIEANLLVHYANLAAAPSPILMEVTSMDTESQTPLIEGTTNVNSLAKSVGLGITEGWWSSKERKAPAADILEVDLGSSRMINWVSFDITRKPAQISIDYDTLDTDPEEENDPREWYPVTLWPLGEGAEIPKTTTLEKAIEKFKQFFHKEIVSSSTEPPWETVKIFFHTGGGSDIASRFLRIRFDRPEPDRNNAQSSFYIAATETLIPYSIDVRNLRVGRYAGTSTAWGLEQG